MTPRDNSREMSKSQTPSSSEITILRGRWISRTPLAIFKVWSLNLPGCLGFGFGALKIFVLADTHNKLPQSVADMAGGAEEIWHLGDVCAEHILDELRAIGPPVIVVRGNCDTNYEWPLVVDLARGGMKFRLQHIPPDEIPNGVDVLLHGHTHVPRNERRKNVLFLNPGCVTRPNRGAPASVAWLNISERGPNEPGKVEWKLLLLR